MRNWRKTSQRAGEALLTFQLSETVSLPNHSDQFLPNFTSFRACSWNYLLVHSKSVCPYCPCLKGELWSILITVGTTSRRLLSLSLEITADHKQKAFDPWPLLLSTPGMPWPDWPRTRYVSDSAAPSVSGGCYGGLGYCLLPPYPEFQIFYLYTEHVLKPKFIYPLKCPNFLPFLFSQGYIRGCGGLGYWLSPSTPISGWPGVRQNSHIILISNVVKQPWPFQKNCYHIYLCSGTMDELTSTSCKS